MSTTADQVVKDAASPFSSSSSSPSLVKFFQTEENQPSVAIRRMLSPRGPLQMLKLLSTLAFTCGRCQQKIISKEVVTVDRSQKNIICANCYSRLLNKKAQVVRDELETLRTTTEESPTSKRCKTDSTPTSPSPPPSSYPLSSPLTPLPHSSSSSSSKPQMYALLFGYSGTAYFGSQINPGVKTVEGVLLHALSLSKVLPASFATSLATTLQDNPFGQVEDLHKLAWQRASRTDKGVHAVRNVISVKLCLPPTTSEAEVCAQLNATLPPDIRVYDLRRTTKHFNAKTECSSRTYQYIVPTYAFLEDYDTWVERPWKWEDVGGGGSEEGRIGVAAAEEEDRMFTRLAELPLPEGLPAKLLSYRISMATVSRIRAMLAVYVGTHRFHNFTKRGDAKDDSFQRHITSFTVSDPWVYPISSSFTTATTTISSSSSSSSSTTADENLLPSPSLPTSIEFLTFEVTGQSFVLHQIRKMIGFLMILISGQPCPGLSLGSSGTSGDIEKMVATFQADTRVNIPPAPSGGLFLTNMWFEKYNVKLTHLVVTGQVATASFSTRRPGEEGGEVAEGGGVVRLPLEWPELATLFEQFRKKLVGEIINLEVTKQTVIRWMYALRRTLNHHPPASS